MRYFATVSDLGSITRLDHHGPFVNLKVLVEHVLYGIVGKMSPPLNMHTSSNASRRINYYTQVKHRDRTLNELLKMLEANRKSVSKMESTVAAANDMEKYTLFEQQQLKLPPSRRRKTVKKFSFPVVDESKKAKAKAAAAAAAAAAAENKTDDEDADGEDDEEEEDNVDNEDDGEGDDDEDDDEEDDDEDDLPPKQIKCPFKACRLKYSSRSTLGKHLRIKHDTNYQELAEEAKKVEDARNRKRAKNRTRDAARRKRLKDEAEAEAAAEVEAVPEIKGKGKGKQSATAAAAAAAAANGDPAVKKKSGRPKGAPNKSKSKAKKKKKENKVLTWKETDEYKAKMQAIFNELVAALVPPGSGGAGGGGSAGGSAGPASSNDADLAALDLSKATDTTAMDIEDGASVDGSASSINGASSLPSSHVGEAAMATTAVALVASLKSEGSPAVATEQAVAAVSSLTTSVSAALPAPTLTAPSTASAATQTSAAGAAAAAAVAAAKGGISKAWDGGHAMVTAEAAADDGGAPSLAGVPDTRTSGGAQPGNEPATKSRASVAAAATVPQAAMAAADTVSSQVQAASAVASAVDADATGAPPSDVTAAALANGTALAEAGSGPGGSAIDVSVPASSVVAGTAAVGVVAAANGNSAAASMDEEAAASSAGVDEAPPSKDSAVSAPPPTTTVAASDSSTSVTSVIEGMTVPMDVGIDPELAAAIVVDSAAGAGAGAGAASAANGDSGGGGGGGDADADAATMQLVETAAANAASITAEAAEAAAVSPEVTEAVRQPRSTRRARRSKLYQALAGGPLDPYTMIKCDKYEGANANEQPFSIVIESNATLIMDIHCHLASTEVIGYIAGYWDPAKKLLRIVSAKPCRALEPGPGQKREQSVEMDPMSEMSVKDEIDQAGLQVVGWYHSHPVFKPEPSVRDIENQLCQQMLFKDDDGNAPFLGVIISPYEKSQSDRNESQMQCFWIDSEDKELLKRDVPLGNPMAFDYAIIPSSPVDHVLLASLRDLMDRYAIYPERIVMSTEWRRTLSKIEKLKVSLRNKLPAATVGSDDRREIVLNGLGEMMEAADKMHMDAKERFEAAGDPIDSDDGGGAAGAEKPLACNCTPSLFTKSGPFGGFGGSHKCPPAAAVAAAAPAAPAAPAPVVSAVSGAAPDLASYPIAPLQELAESSKRTAIDIAAMSAKQSLPADATEEQAIHAVFAAVQKVAQDMGMSLSLGDAASVLVAADQSSKASAGAAPAAVPAVEAKYLDPDRTCPKCGKFYTSASSRNRHIKDLHGSGGTHTCFTCGAPFGTLEELIAHHKMCLNRSAPVNDIRPGAMVAAADQGGGAGASSGTFNAAMFGSDVVDGPAGGLGVFAAAAAAALAAAAAATAAPVGADKSPSTVSVD